MTIMNNFDNSSTVQQTLTLNHFLDDQQKRLSKKTYDKYKSVIELYESYLDNYAYLFLNNEDHTYYEEQFNKHKKMLCELFGPEKILDGYGELFGYFLPKKVLAKLKIFKTSDNALIICRATSLVALQYRRIYVETSKHILISTDSINFLDSPATLQ